MFDAGDASFMYMHTSFSEETSVLLIEAVVIKRNGKIVEKGVSAGFACCYIFNAAEAGKNARPIQVPVQLGSPRMKDFVTDIEQKNRAGKTILTYQF